MQHQGTSRIIRISSHDAIEWKSNSEYTVDLQNSIPELSRGIHGLSVDACGFRNSFPNLPASAAEPDGPRMYIAVRDDISNVIHWGQFFTVPAGWWQQSEVVSYLTRIFANGDTLNVPWGGTSALSVHLSTPAAGENSLDHRFLFQTDPGYHVEIHGDKTNYTLPEYLGFHIDPTIAELHPLQSTHHHGWDAQPPILGAPPKYQTLAPHLPNLQGEHVAFVHSGLLAHDQRALDGEGKLTSIIATVPITVEFSGVESYNPGAALRPTVIYRRPLTVRHINIALKDIYGRGLDVGAGEFWCVLRVWW